MQSTQTFATGSVYSFVAVKTVAVNDTGLVLTAACADVTGDGATVNAILCAATGAKLATAVIHLPVVNLRHSQP